MTGHYPDSVMLSRFLKVVLIGLLAGMACKTVAEDDLGKSLFLVVESDRVVAVNAETGQFFDLVLSAKERIQDRFIANRVAVLITNQRFAGVGSYPSGWNSQRRKAGEEIISAEAVDYSALVVTSDRILTFNGRNGTWSEQRR